MEKRQATRQNSARRRVAKTEIRIKQQKISTGLKLHYTEIATKKKAENRGAARQKRTLEQTREQNAARGRGVNRQECTTTTQEKSYKT